MEKQNKHDHSHLVIMGTSEIVAAFASSGTITPEIVGQVIADVHAALKLVCHEVTAPGVIEKQQPAISIGESIKDDKLTCLECGERFVSIKRHLMSAHGLSPAEYRKKWKLADDYPMISPTYSSTRSTLAKDMGLGAKVGKSRGGSDDEDENDQH